MMRPLANGPRSLIFTTTDCPVSIAVTWTRVPIGSDLCAAVSSPREVRPRAAPGYQVAVPSSLHGC
jgi:hypothetical protein